MNLFEYINLACSPDVVDPNLLEIQNTTRWLLFYGGVMALWIGSTLFWTLMY